MPELDWNDLRFVLALARGTTLAAAARRLGVNESTVGRRIARAEQRLGARLFDRMRGAFHLSAAGAVAVAGAERVEQELQALTAALAGTDRAAAGTVRLTSVPLLVNRILVPALPALLNAHPGLRVELIAEPRNLSLTKREADIALRLARPERELRTIARRVGQLDYALYGSADRSAAALPWLTYEDAMADLPQSRWIAEQAGDAALLAVNDAEALMAGVKAGLGKALLPIAVAEQEAGLARLDSGPPALSRELWLMVHPDLRDLTRVRTVMDWVALVMPKVPPG